MHHFAYKDGELFAEDVAISELAERFGTPLYLYSLATLRRHIRRFQAALEGTPHLLAFSVKACPNLAIVGCGREHEPQDRVSA